MLFLLGLILALWAFVWEPSRLTVHPQTISLERWPPQLNGLKITAISDLHIGANFMTLDKLGEVVERCNQQQADLIILLGDYVTNDHDSGEAVIAPELFATTLQKLRAPQGVFAVLGNHDWWFSGAKTRRAIENAGIRVLENEAVQLKYRGHPYWLAGIGDHFTKHHNVPGTLAAVTDDAPVIALTHSPDLFPELPDRIVLTLAGHTHGGQVNLPVLGRRVVPSRYGDRYAIGLVYEAGHSLFVTPGIGTSILPVRFRVPPEISVLTLSGRADK